MVGVTVSPAPLKACSMTMRRRTDVAIAENAQAGGSQRDDRRIGVKRRMTGSGR